MNETGSFSDDNGDGNENVKTTTLHVQRTFVHFFAVTARLRREILSRNVLWRTQIHHDEFFPSLSELEFGLQKFNSRKILLYLTF